MRQRAGLVAVLVLLGGCGVTPAVNTAPIGGNMTRHCQWVREQIANGAMPVSIGEQWYAYCGPFQLNLNVQEWQRR